MGIPMICTDRLRYNRRDLRAEDPFEAESRRDARVLVAMGKARYESGEAPPPEVFYKKTRRKKKTSRKYAVRKASNALCDD